MPATLSKVILASSLCLIASAASISRHESSLVTSVTANPSGAGGCDIWRPDFSSRHARNLATGGNTVTVAATSYTPGTAVTLSIAASGPFEGFQIYALDATGRRVGVFSTTGTNSAGKVKDQGCTSGDDTKPWIEGSTFTHSDQVPKPQNMQLKWTPDPTASGTVTFMTAVMPNSSQFYKATVITLPRAAGAPAPVNPVQPPQGGNQGGGGQGTVGPIQTVPTDGKLTIQGMQEAQTFNPYLKLPAYVPPTKTAPGAGSGAGAGAGAGGNGFGIFEDASGSLQSGGGNQGLSRTSFNPAGVKKRTSQAHNTAQASVTIAMLLTVAGMAISMCV